MRAHDYADPGFVGKAGNVARDIIAEIRSPRLRVVKEIEGGAKVTRPV